MTRLNVQSWFFLNDERIYLLNPHASGKRFYSEFWLLDSGFQISIFKLKPHLFLHFLIDPKTGHDRAAPLSTNEELSLIIIYPGPPA